MRKMFAAATLAVCTSFTYAHAIAQVVYRPMVPRSSRVEKRSFDGSREVVYPDGRHEFYEPNGAPRGINRTCSNGGGLIVSCHYWGPNHYGGPN